MISPADPPRWRALQIGPGGLPADQVRPVGPGAPTGPEKPGAAGASFGYGARNGPGAAARTAPASRHPGVPGAAQGNVPVDVLPALWQNWAASTPAPPRRGPSNSTISKIVGALVILGLVIGLAVWANNTSPLRGSGGVAQIGVGQCLSSTGQRIAGEVDCAGGQADFAVVGRYADTSDASECSASPADVAVVVSGPTLLCLDYIAVVGDCLFAGPGASEVGKVDCASTLPSVYRVTAVLQNSIDPESCPPGTSQTLVHRHNSEVICLTRS